MSNSIWADLLGAEVRLLQGPKYRTRIIQAGQDKPETLLLIHGGGGHVETFARNVVPLGQQFHTIALEMLWHGLSSAPELVPPPAGDRNAQVGEQVLEVLDALGKDRVWILGEAAGANVVGWLALHHPERLKGLMFESTGGGSGVQSTGGLSMGQFTLQLLENPSWEAVRERLLMVMHADHPERVTDELVDVRLALYSGPAHDSMRRYYEYSGQYGYASALTDAQKSQLDANLASMPILAIANDESAVPADGKGPILGAKYVLLKGTGIWGHWEEPEQFNELVRRFIAEQA